MAYSNPEDQKACHRRWYTRNKESKRAKNAAWAAAHPDKMREYSQKHELTRPHRDQREYNRVRYAANPTKANLRAVRNRSMLSAIKLQPCADCGNIYPPCAMDFDHGTNTKTFALGDVTSTSITRLLAEVNKCEVVCAVCHRVRHWKRRELS